MKLLVVAGNYPHAGHSFSGAFTERCVCVLNGLCQDVEVIVPRPYVPSFLASVHPRWKSYKQIPSVHSRKGITIHRPACAHVPRFGSSFWSSTGAFWGCRETALKLYAMKQLHAILSFDISSAGGVAWRLGKVLGLPACGWAFGSDVRVPKCSWASHVVKTTLRNLDLVFYQSHELLQKAAELLDVPSRKMMDNRHIVLPHGIPAPPSLDTGEIRNRVRSNLSISKGDILVLNVGRVVREKGLFELIEALLLAGRRDPRIKCVIVGSQDGYDQTADVQKRLDEIPLLRKSVTLVPACDPEAVWDYLCAADIFAFPSHKEGMPNALLEAMIMGVPAVAFGIPPVNEIDMGRGALLTVPPLEADKFGQAILQLANNPEQRRRIGQCGREVVLSRFLMKENMKKAVAHVESLLQSSHVAASANHFATS